MSTLFVDRPAEGVTRITLQRPERLNAMNATLVAELHDELESIVRDQSCRVVVLTGGGRGFCAGIDLSGYGDAPHAAGRGRVEDTFATQTHIAALVPRLRGLPQPVIAAVNGALRAEDSPWPWPATSALPGHPPVSTSPSFGSAFRGVTSESVGCSPV